MKFFACPNKQCMLCRHQLSAMCVVAAWTPKTTYITTQRRPWENTWHSKLKFAWELILVLSVPSAHTGRNHKLSRGVHSTVKSASKLSAAIWMLATWCVSSPNSFASIGENRIFWSKGDCVPIKLALWSFQVFKGVASDNERVAKGGLSIP